MFKFTFIPQHQTRGCCQLLTFSTKAFTPALHHAFHQQPSQKGAIGCRAYLSWASVAMPVSTGAGVPEGSKELSRGAMTTTDIV